MDQRRPIWGGNCVSRHGLHRAFDQTGGFLIVDVDLVLVDDGPDLPVQIVGDLTDLLGQEFIVAGLQSGDGLGTGGLVGVDADGNGALHRLGGDNDLLGTDGQHAVELAALGELLVGEVLGGEGMAAQIALDHQLTVDHLGLAVQQVDPGIADDVI